MIAYNKQNHTIKLDTPNTSYVLGVREGGFLLNLYYGRRLPDDNLWSLAKRLPSASFSPCDPEHTDFSADVAPMEYPTNGRGDFRAAALSVRNADGNTVTDLRYVSHRVIAGKPDLPGLPQLYVTDDAQCETLEVTLRDPYTGVEAVLVYTAFCDCDVIAKHVRLTNRGEQAVTLERALSSCLDLPSMGFDLITLWGRHTKERQLERRPLAHGLQGIRSKRGASSHSHNPFAALVQTGATETTGEVYGFNLVYSGNFVITAEVDHDATTRVVMGIDPEDFGWLLAPGESFATPEAVHVFSSEGLGGMSRVFHRCYDAHLIRGRWQTEKRPLLINSWEAAYFDFDTDKLISFAERAKELGIEMLVMDDGWFGKRNDDTNSLGDWFVNEKKLDLGRLIDSVHGMGLKFGIWYEPEMISPDSELYRTHPDWCVHVPGRAPSVARQQYVLDVSRLDVRENIFGQMRGVLGRYPIDYVKWDFNRNLSEAGSALLPADRSGEFFHRFVLGTYALQDRLIREFPHLLLENCSGGGGRFDPGMLYYSPQIWTSDNTDPIDRLSIQFGTSLCYPASVMGAHVSASRRAGYRTKGDVALWGTFGYELDPNKLNGEEREIVKEQVAQYHKYYALIRSGSLYRLICPWNNDYVCAWSFVAEDKREALVTVVRMRRQDDTLFHLKLQGLDPDTIYTVEETGERYSGALLMFAGLEMTDSAWDDGESCKLHLIADGAADPGVPA
ncbi:MAG: alpha-galactosidase [Clostridia bacterium]|nr:alpha-galactosidase [Clostridia bacterium]